MGAASESMNAPATIREPGLPYGEAYFAYQKIGGQKCAVYNRKFFAPFIHASDAVLDFGCGGGYLLQLLSCRTRTGIDINPAARAEANRQSIEAWASLEELGDTRFDTVISSHCLEHVANPYETLRAIRRVLRPSGKLVLLLPLDDWRSEPWRGADINGHLYAWTPKLLGNLLKASGFEPTFIRVVNHVVPPRIDRKLWALSKTVFEISAYVSSVALRRRQIWALAHQESHETDL